MREAGKRRALIAALLALCVLLPMGCSSRTAPPERTAQSSASSDESSLIRTEGRWRMGESETMIYCFNLKDFTIQEAEMLLADAEALSGALCVWLDVDASDMVSTDGKKATCYFDSSFRMDDGQKRSQADTRNRKIYCVTPSDYVHEYVHLVTDCSQRQISLPSNLMLEGLATYIGFTWQDTVIDTVYAGIPPAKAGGLSTDPTEKAAMEQMLADASLELTPLNVYRVGVAYSCKVFGMDQVLDTETENPDFYHYRVGCILIDYLMKQSGGKEDVMALYFDAMRAEELYGVTIDELIGRALEDCIQTFQ